LRVVGLDISKASVAACLLLEKPSEPRQFYFDCQFRHFHADVAGINALLALNADIAVMEPTGINYQKLWGTHLARAGISVYLVGHSELKAYRKYLGFLDNKDDDADALALACYWWDYHSNPRRFIQLRDFLITRIRELVLRLAHLNRVQSPIINRLRQDLAWQFPEVALTKSKRESLSGNLPLLWAWLAGEKRSLKYDRLLAKSVGLGVCDTVRLHAQRICHLQREEVAIERELIQLLNALEFIPYRKVFSIFGFGLGLQAILISQIYPLSNYLDKDGKPEIIVRRGRKSGKPTKRYLSERRFMRSLGVAPGKDASGDKELDRVGGSDLCRISLWQWVFTRIEPKRSRPKTDIGKQLGETIDAEKLAGRPIKLVRTRVAARAVRLLFKQLVQALKFD
jgi:transposase